MIALFFGNFYMILLCKRRKRVRHPLHHLVTLFRLITQDKIVRILLFQDVPVPKRARCTPQIRTLFIVDRMQMLASPAAALFSSGAKPGNRNKILWLIVKPLLQAAGEPLHCLL